METKERLIEKIKRYLPQIKRFGPPILVAIVLTVTLVTCIHKQPPQPEEPEPTEQSPIVIAPSPPVEKPTPTPEPEPEQEPEPEPEPEYTGPLNPLTGLPIETDMSNVRPLAIMINNHIDAMPQLGVSKADIIYEVPVEGTTRMLAIYQDASEVGRIGSIRSARLYFLDIAQGYDAVYIFAGGSPQAYSAISARKPTHLDGTGYTGGPSDIFYRDSQRQQTMAIEHTLLTTGDLINKWLPTYGFRLEHEEGYESNLEFTEEAAPDGGSPAADISVSFLGLKTTTFSYAPESKLYFLRQHGREYIDGNDETQLSVTNVLVLKTAVSNIPGDSAGRLNIVTTGSGSGYFICGGKYIDIEWSRENESSQFEYTLPDGSDLVLGQGKSYICIISNNSEVVFG